MLVQVIKILFAHIVRIGDDLLRKRHHRHFGRGETGIAEIPGDGCQFFRGEEILTEHRSVCQQSVGAFERHGCGKGHQLIAPQPHLGLD